MDLVDIVHGLSGHCPWTEWTLSMDSVDNVHGLSGYCPWTQWTMSMDSKDIVHGPSFQYASRTMSTESMDFLQTGYNHCHAMAGLIRTLLFGRENPNALVSHLI